MIPGLFCLYLRSNSSPPTSLSSIDGVLMVFVDNLYDDDESESGSGWIQWFCDLEGHEYFIEVRNWK